MSQTAIDILVPALCGASIASAISAAFDRARINRLERKVQRLDALVFDLQLQFQQARVEYFLDRNTSPDQEQG